MALPKDTLLHACSPKLHPTFPHAAVSHPPSPYIVSSRIHLGILYIHIISYISLFLIGCWRKGQPVLAQSFILQVHPTASVSMQQHSYFLRTPVHTPWFRCHSPAVPALAASGRAQRKSIVIFPFHCLMAGLLGAISQDEVHDETRGLCNMWISIHDQPQPHSHSIFIQKMSKFKDILLY